jgi:hypothetical protein
VKLQGLDMTRLLTIVIPMLGPFLVWVLFYAVARRNRTRVNSFLTWIKVFRWVAWLAGIALSIFWLVKTQAGQGNTHAVFSWWIVNGFFVFQLGLSFPESWLKSERARIDRLATNDPSIVVG